MGIIDVKVNFRLLLVLKRTHWALTQDGIPGHFQVSSFDMHRQIMLVLAVEEVGAFVTGCALAILTPWGLGSGSGF